MQELHTLEEEGAIYDQVWQENTEDLRFCRIQFRPAEIVAYVDACSAYDEFLAQYELYGDPTMALSLLKNTEIRKQVEEYNEWVGHDDQAYCFAAFIGAHLEALVLGDIPERCEFLSQTYSGDRRFLLTEILEMFPSSATHLSNRKGNRPSYSLEQEQDVRDLLYVIIKSIFPDARIEEYTRKHAGSAKIIDIVIPLISTVIETKYVRDPQHANKVADELKIDIESYHVHAHCKTLIAYVWDPDGYIVDRPNFIKDLRGLRQKNGNKFKVEVMIKP